MRDGEAYGCAVTRDYANLNLGLESEDRRQAYPPPFVWGSGMSLAQHIDTTTSSIMT